MPSQNSFWQKFSYSIRAFFLRKKAESELDSELRFHLESQVEFNIRAGMSPEVARQSASREFGSVALAKEECRDERGTQFLEQLWQDVRFGLRMLRVNPGFTSVTLLTLALGMGANTALFSVVDAALLRPFPFPHLEKLAMVWETAPHLGFEPELVAPADYLDWVKQASVFNSLAAYRGWDADLTGAGEPEHLQGARVSTGFFPTVGVEAVMGRTFSPDEEQSGKDQVAVISYGLWQERFAGDSSVLDANVKLNGAPFRIIGVMPADFSFPPATTLWTPLTLSPDFVQDRSNQTVRTIARLKSGSTPAKAQTEMNTIAARLEQEYPRENKGRRVAVALLRDRVAGGFSATAIWSLMGAVGLFALLIACANIASMQLARATARHREMAIRASIGATRSRIVRQLLTESVLLALLGGAAGIIFALLLQGLLKTAVPPAFSAFIPGFHAIAINARALGFTFICAVLTGIVFGLAPALRVSRPDLVESLKEGEKSAGPGKGRRKLRSFLVVSELALALVLLVGAGLMVRGFKRIADGEKQGFNPQNVLTMGVSLNRFRYTNEFRVIGFYKEALKRVETLPGVVSASAVVNIPASGAWSTTKFQIEGKPDPVAGETQATNFQIVTPHYFQTMEIPLQQGRDFTDGDTAESQMTIVISEEFARRYFPNANPLGQRIRLSQISGNWATVVGEVGDVKRFMFDSGMRPTVYLSYAQAPVAIMHLAVRTSRDPLQIESAVRAQLHTVDKEQPVFDVKTIEQIISEQVSGIRLGAYVMGLYGFLALVLAAVGVYGIMAYSVEQRTHEFGVRIAMGAQTRDILKMVLGHGLKLTGIGLGIGLLVAFAFTRLMAKVFFGMMAVDFATFVAFTALLTIVALLSSFIPALGAARVDPIVTLRHE